MEMWMCLCPYMEIWANECLFDEWVCLSSRSLGASLRACVKMTGCAFKARDGHVVVPTEEHLQVGKGK